MKTQTQALAEGYTIDRSAPGRPIGYKGVRFQPTDLCEVLTELEEQLVNALAQVSLIERDRTSSDNEKLRDMARIARDALAIARA